MKASKHSVHWQFSAMMFFIIATLLTFQLANLAVQREYSLIELWNVYMWQFSTRTIMLAILASVVATLISLNYALPLDLLNENNRLSRQLNAALRALKAYERDPARAAREQRATLVLSRTGDVVIPFRQERKDA